MNKIERELKKKAARRGKAIPGWDLDSFVKTKKPMDYSFDGEQVDDFRYPVDIGNTIIEKKSDGFGVHIIVGDEVAMYSLSGNAWNPAAFPELELDQLPKGYFQGEILGAPTHDGFSASEEFTAIQKRSKHSVPSASQLAQYPLDLDLFDVLRLGDEIMLEMPMIERSYRLDDVVADLHSSSIAAVDQWRADSPEYLHTIFAEAMDKGYEGLIAKDPESFYIPGSRDSDWLKLKGFLTLDLAVLGLYETDASIKAGKPFAAMLVGSYNEQSGKFETMAKVKVGKKTEAERIYAALPDVVRTDGDYQRVLEAYDGMLVNPAMQKTARKIPAQMVRYAPGDEITIVEVQTLDITHSENWHSCGYDGAKAHSLRIPSYKRLREDKTKLIDVTSTSQIQDMI